MLIIGYMMKTLTLLSVFIMSFACLSSELPSSLKSCEFQNIYANNELIEVIIKDNVGSRLAGCPREMIYKYSEYRLPRIQVLRLTHAQRGECWYGNVTCKAK
jgi:hypothetical protein